MFQKRSSNVTTFHILGYHQGYDQDLTEQTEQLTNMSIEWFSSSLHASSTATQFYLYYFLIHPVLFAHSHRSDFMFTSTWPDTHGHPSHPAFRYWLRRKGKSFPNIGNLVGNDCQISHTAKNAQKPAHP